MLDSTSAIAVANFVREMIHLAGRRGLEKLIEMLEEEAVYVPADVFRRLGETDADVKKISVLAALDPEARR